MGRNAAIKHFDLTPDGQPISLFDDKKSRTPVIIELLHSPWIVRAVDLLRRDGTGATKHTEQVIDVEWDHARQLPSFFIRDDRRYRIQAVIQVWAADRAWWDPHRRLSRRFWRVLAAGGTYDIAYDRTNGIWLLVGIQD